MDFVFKKRVFLVDFAFLSVSLGIKNTISEVPKNMQLYLGKAAFLFEANAPCGLDRLVTQILN